jgi:hypothetical protein
MANNNSFIELENCLMVYPILSAHLLELTKPDQMLLQSGDALLTTYLYHVSHHRTSVTGRLAQWQGA